MTDLRKIQEAIIEGNSSRVLELLKAAINDGVDPQVIVNEGMISAMSIVGERFKKNEIYVPEVLIAARAMQEGLNIIKPLLAEVDMKKVGKVVLGTVFGDLHDIGKNLVKIMLEGNGFEVIDLGVDVSPEQFVESVKSMNPTHVAMSALLTTTMPAMKDTIDALKAEGLREAVKIIIGGAPVTAEFAEEIGADGYGPDAASAVDLAKELVGAKKY